MENGNSIKIDHIDCDIEKSFVLASHGARFLKAICHGLAKRAGWWTNLETGADETSFYPDSDIRLIAEKLCLIHSEVSEAMEGARKRLPDTHLTHRSMLEVELADVVIRVFDLAGGLDLNIAGAIAEKLEYNASRQDHQLESRLKPNGKRF